MTEAAADPTRLLEGDPSIVCVCRPNDPTGVLLRPSWLEDLDAGGDEGPLLVIDEAHAEFSKDTVISLAQRVSGVLVTRTASKAFGLAGVRCGFGVARPETALEVEKSRGPFKVSGLAAAAFAAALCDDSD